MVSGSKHLVAMRKNAIDLALGSLEHKISICSKETPNATARTVNALERAIDDDTLYAEEITKYKKRISDYIKEFEEGCDCFHIIVPKDNIRRG